MGGKRLLAKKIIALQKKIDHCCYVEPFVGMGGVFLRRGCHNSHGGSAGENVPMISFEFEKRFINV